MILLFLEWSSSSPRDWLHNGRVLEVIKDKLNNRHNISFRPSYRAA